MKKLGWRERLDRLRERLEEWAKAVESRVRPEPERLPVPVPVRVPRGPSQR